MTALTAFLRLEAAGLWRESEEAQRREVIVSLGDATLILKDMQDRALTHWSLAAIERANPGETPAIYHPDGDPGESLTLGDDARDMVEAIETLRRAIARARPKQGRLRLGLSLLVVAGLAAIAALWLPGALRNQALTVVPEVKRDAIGLALLEEITQLTGPPCRATAAAPSLRSLARRVLGPERGGDLIILRSGALVSAHLPGGFILLNRTTLEDVTTPEASAGFALMEDLRAQTTDPLADLLMQSGLWATTQLLTTGDMPQSALAAYARTVMITPPVDLPLDTITAGFAAASLPLSPYAYALDVTGESTLELIEADSATAVQGPAMVPVLSDNDWLRLQTICQ